LNRTPPGPELANEVFIANRELSESYNLTLCSLCARSIPVTCIYFLTEALEIGHGFGWKERVHQNLAVFLFNCHGQPEIKILLTRVNSSSYLH